MTRANDGAEAKEGGFWKTEEYFEKRVWRNYVEQHRDFFDEGDAETCRRLGMVVQEDVDVEVPETMSWAVSLY